MAIPNLIWPPLCKNTKEKALFDVDEYFNLLRQMLVVVNGIKTLAIHFLLLKWGFKVGLKVFGEFSLKFFSQWQIYEVNGILIHFD